jgi:hypothetical protein
MRKWYQTAFSHITHLGNKWRVHELLTFKSEKLNSCHSLTDCTKLPQWAQPSAKVNSHSGREEIRSLLGKIKIHYGLHENQSLDTDSHKKQIQPSDSIFLMYTLIVSYQIRYVLFFTMGSSFQISGQKHCTHFYPPTRVTCPAHLTSLDFIILIHICIGHACMYICMYVCIL